MINYSLLGQTPPVPLRIELLSLIISSISVIVAALSYDDSRKSRKIARKSKEIAEESKEIAEESNKIAEESNKIAEESNTITLNREKVNLKEAAIDLFFNWAKERQDSWSYAVEFAASLDAEDNTGSEVKYKSPLIQTWQFWKVESIEVRKNTEEEDQRELLRRLRDSNSSLGSTQLPNTDEQKILIARDELVKVRWLVMSYFNLLEVILLAWKHKTVDTDILINQFQPLINENPRFPKNFFLIDNQTDDKFPIPKTSFPTIAEFIKEYGSSNP
ncbi:MAG: hypothetical protein F6K48_23710 [Okeania sp. SIO3H1]|nr:hypothetical protein [Okeania sp. SIO3H1]